MLSSVLWRRVAVVRTDVAEEHITYVNRVKRISELGQLLAVRSFLILFNLMIEAIRPSESSVPTRYIRHHIPEDGILHSHLHGNLKSYIALTGWTLYWRRNVSPVKYELGFCIPEDGIRHSHHHENLKSYITLTGWTV
jgi:hypothetical protein